jgi:hypothetical protein
MSCPYLNDGRCQLAEAVAQAHAGLQIECRPDERRCARCLAKSPSEDQIPAACLGLVTPHIPREHLAEWSGIAVALSSSGPVVQVQAPTTSTRSRGLGDTVAKFFKAIGVHGIGKTMRTAARRLTGKPGCGCQATQQWLNERVPYRTRRR